MRPNIYAIFFICILIAESTSSVSIASVYLLPQHGIMANQAKCTHGVRVFSYTGTSQSFTVAPEACRLLKFKVWGAGGSGRNKSGGGAGFASAQYYATHSETLTIVVGGGGKPRSGISGGAGGYGGGGKGGNGGESKGGGAGGGGFSGIFKGTISLSNAVLIAGGGAGGANYAGGSGGGDIGASGPTDGLCWGPSNGGGQSAGGVSGLVIRGTSMVRGSNGASLKGGNGGSGSQWGGGGGGGGYYGGGGGGGDYGWLSCNYGSAGSGGSGGGGGANYIGFVELTATVSAQGSGALAANNSDLDYIDGIGTGAIDGITGGNGYVVVSW